MNSRLNFDRLSSYLTNAEIEILHNKADTIVAMLGLDDGGIVVELGSG